MHRVLSLSAGVHKPVLPAEGTREGWEVARACPHFLRKAWQWFWLSVCHNNTQEDPQHLGRLVLKHPKFSHDTTLPGSDSLFQLVCFFKTPQATIEPCLGDNQEQRQSAQES